MSALPRCTCHPFKAVIGDYSPTCARHSVMLKMGPVADHPLNTTPVVGQKTTEMTRNVQIARELREKCGELRQRPIPLSQLIPLMQRAADSLDSGVEIDRDDDGEVLIDWSPGKGRMVTLCLRDDGRLSYAFTWDGEQAHGTAQMPNKTPQEQQK